VKRDTTVLGLFFFSLVGLQLIIGISFEIGFMTPFKWLDITNDKRNFIFSLVIQSIALFGILYKIETNGKPESEVSKISLGDIKAWLSPLLIMVVVLILYMIVITNV
jgi:hypothetical protein